MKNKPITTCIACKHIEADKDLRLSVCKASPRIKMTDPITGRPAYKALYFGEIHLTDNPYYYCAAVNRDLHCKKYETQEA